MASCEHPKIEPPAETAKLPESFGGPSPAKRRMIEAAPQPGSNNEEKVSRMKLRSGKNLPPFGCRPQYVKPKSYARCRHRILDAPPLNLDFFRDLGLEIIEEEQTDCRCVAEKGLTSIKVYRFRHPNGEISEGCMPPPPKRPRRGRKYVFSQSRVKELFWHTRR